MVLFNYSTKEITAKVVYYGPGLCGKTTNLQFIYDNLPQNIQRGRMLSLATKTDRTLFFDFLPIDLGTIRGMKTRVQLYTVPGQVFYNSTRKLVLKGADGIVFVADSQEKMKEANLESFRNLEENCIENGINITETPLVLQFNKRDLPGIASVEDLSNTLNKYNAPFYESVATTGIGVHETLKGVTKLVLHSLREKYAAAASGKPAAPPPRVAAPPPPAAPAPPVVAAPPVEEKPPVLQEEAAAPSPPEAPLVLEEETTPAEAPLVLEEETTPAAEPIVLEEEPVAAMGTEEPILLDEEPATAAAGEGLDAVFAEAEGEVAPITEEPPRPTVEPPVVEGLLMLADEPADPSESFADLADEFGTDPPAPAAPVKSAPTTAVAASHDREEEDPLGLGPTGAEGTADVAVLPTVTIEPGTEEVEIPLDVHVGDEVQRYRLRLRISLTRDA